MYDDAKVQAFFAFHDLLTNPEVRMDAQEQYDELLRLVDNFKAKGIIDGEEQDPDRGGDSSLCARCGGRWRRDLGESGFT